MSIKGFYLMPHPPIVLPEVGKGEEEKIKETKSSMEDIGKDIAEKAPDTIIIVTPHGVMFQDAVSLSFEEEISGSLNKFGVSDFNMEIPINKALTSKIYELSYEENLPCVMATNKLLDEYRASVYLDHGAMIPLYFVNKYYKNYKLVHITYAPLSDIELYKFGINIKRAVEELSEDVVFIASGDLSHRLKEEGPYDFSPFGEKFDREFLEALKKGSIKEIFDIDEETVSEAGECGRRSVALILGALEGKKFNGELLSYEKTFGVGYGVMKFNVLSEDEPRLKDLMEIRDKKYEKRKNQKDPYVRLARESLTSYLCDGSIIKKLPSYVPEEMKSTKRGVFVSLKKHGELRGCIGTIYPVTGSLAEEIVKNSLSAGLSDPRFNKVRKEELDDISFSVDELMEPEVAERSELNPKEYGVIVKNGGRTGLLLPDLEGVNTVEEQIDIALKKAGIDREELYTIEKFRVVRHKEEP